MASDTEITSPARRSHVLIVGLLTVQILSAAFFLTDLWGEVLGLRTAAWPFWTEEVGQILASLGLVAGIAAGLIYMRRAEARIDRLDRQIGAVSGDFERQLHERFQDWGLSSSEAEIALFAMKGFSNAEIGALRGTSAATVKCQMNAVFRKSGIDNRQQLTSFMVEELLEGVGPARPTVALAA